MKKAKRAKRIRFFITKLQGTLQGRKNFNGHG